MMGELLALFAALAIPILLGLATLHLLLGPTTSAADRAGRVALAIGIGLGLSSCLYFVWLALPLRSPGSLVGLDLLSLGAAVALAVLRRPAVRPSAEAPRGARSGAAAGWVLGPVLGAIVAAAVYAYWHVYDAQPHGAWDAFAMYNARARFLVRAGAGWLDAFEISPLFHPDYPALVPCAVARIWTYTGSETTLAPAWVGFLFAVSTGLLLFSVLATHRGATAATLAVVLLCGLGTVQYGNDSLVLLAALQLADVPFAFLLLAALALAIPEPGHRLARLGAAGLAVSLAAWCKNEGALVVVVFLGGLALVEAWGDGLARALRRVGAALVGAAPVLTLVLVYKVWIAPSGEILSDSNVGIVDKILDPSRYSEIGRQVSGALLDYDGGALVAFALALGAIGLRPRSQWRAAALPALVVLGVGAGYLAVYVITPHELAWHVLSSKYRLLTQLWPAVLLAGFMLVRSPEMAFNRLAPHAGPPSDDCAGQPR